MEECKQVGLCLRHDSSEDALCLQPVGCRESPESSLNKALLKRGNLVEPGNRRKQQSGLPSVTYAHVKGSLARLARDSDNDDISFSRVENDQSGRRLLPVTPE
jgi:hypothetical protein